MLKNIGSSFLQRLERFLTKNGLKGEQISVKYDSNGFIVSDSYGTKAISENGYHTGILYEGKVYDNIHPEGMPYQQ
uniref:Tox-PL-2 domain-containing protein n=2 Tax=Paenibacillus athensensis TaxID=1967502 RepID=A0A4Y8PV14_9BACL